MKRKYRDSIWKKDGLPVGEIAYRSTIPSDTKSNKKSEFQFELKPSQEDGWCLTHTIKLSPHHVQQFLSFLEQREASPRKVAEEERAGRKRKLARADSMILKWGEEQKEKNASIKPVVV